MFSSEFCCWDIFFFRFVEFIFEKKNSLKFYLEKKLNSIKSVFKFPNKLTKCLSFKKYFFQQFFSQEIQECSFKVKTADTKMTLMLQCIK